MSILNKIASAQDRRDELPNIELATLIAQQNDRKSIQELIKHLQNMDRSIQNDCIKVLYETGILKPDLIAGHIDEFLALLNHKNNRLQWGGMTALNCITREVPDKIHSHLPQLVNAAAAGSVITKDQLISILITLSSIRLYSEDAQLLLLEQLKLCALNQLPMYAERALPIIDVVHKAEYLEALSYRLAGIDKESKRKRIESVIKKLSE